MAWGRGLAALVAALGVVASANAADQDARIRAGGVQLAVADGWTRVVPADEDPDAEPRTLLVVGTKGARAIASPCRVAAYRVPLDGAVIVVIGWKRPPVLDDPLFPLSQLRLRRHIFQCFEGRGGVGQISLRGRDYQVNVLVGDQAKPDVVADALRAAHSFSLSS